MLDLLLRLSWNGLVGVLQCVGGEYFTSSLRVRLSVFCIDVCMVMY